MGLFLWGKGKTDHSDSSQAGAQKRRNDSLRRITFLLRIFEELLNFVLPHASLRQPLAEPVRTCGTGAAKLWRPCTPAMAAGLTDHIWRLKEVLLYRVPPWPQARLG